MSWWWRTRALALTIASLLGGLLLAMVLDSTVVPLPSLVGALFVPVVLAFLIPLVSVTLFCHGLDRATAALERVAVRDLTARDHTIVLGAVALTAAVVVPTWQLEIWSLGPGYLRNLLGSLGLALLAIPIVGSRVAAVAPVAAVIASALFGTGMGGQVHWWAWPIADADSWRAFTIASTLLIAGLITHRLRHDHPPLLNF